MKRLFKGLSRRHRTLGAVYCYASVYKRHVKILSLSLGLGENLVDWYDAYFNVLVDPAGPVDVLILVLRYI